MKHIETPVQVIYTDDPRSEGGEPFIVDAYGYKMLLRGIGVGVGGLDDRAVEVARAINAHDALVEALEVALRNVRHLSNCPAHIASLRPAGPCDCGADDAKERVYDALILASGEQE